jgi:hypothetical protein
MPKPPDSPRRKSSAGHICQLKSNAVMGVEKMKEVPVNRYPQANANRYVWFDGRLVRVKNAKINVLSPTSQYGLNVFEGIRCYWSEEKKQLFAFRLEDHLKRLKQSQKLL